MAKYEEHKKNRERKINTLTKELEDLNQSYEDLQTAMGTQTVVLEKCQDQLRDQKAYNEDMSQKLHMATQGRHDFEVRLAEEFEKGHTM